LRWFLRYQGFAFRALFRRRKRSTISLDVIPAGPGHPSELCRCRDGQPAIGVFDDHLPDCAWAAAMCRQCGGTGWCQECGGSGDRPTDSALGNPPAPGGPR
jgi:hypothetical protein